MSEAAIRPQDAGAEAGFHGFEALLTVPSMAWSERDPKEGELTSALRRRIAAAERHVSRREADPGVSEPAAGLEAVPQPQPWPGGPISTRAGRDLLLALFATAVLGALAVANDAFDATVAFIAAREGQAFEDGLVMVFVLALCLAWYAYRRWSEGCGEMRRRMKAEAARDALYQQLNQAQKMTAIGNLAGGIAHDFNNLLMVINGFGQRAAGHLDDAAILRESLEQIVQAGERGAALTRQLLIFSRRQVLEKEVVTVAALFEEVQGLLDHAMTAKFGLYFDLENPDSRIETDRNEFVQALLNLVINACDAMPQGGRIVVSCRDVEDPAGGRGWICIGVQDSGHGMDAETRKRIFEPFYTTKERDKGTGLGLAMVYGFVQSCGGRIGVESEPGAGTKVLLSFPRSRSPLVRAKAEESGARPGRGETVLLVEDNEALLKLLKAQLEELGYKVLVASGGFWALELEEDYAGTIDLLLTDIIMPGMSGIELAAAMRETRPQMKTVFMSGYSDETKKTGELPADAVYVQKPVKLDRLAGVIRDTIEMDEGLPRGRSKRLGMPICQSRIRT